MPNKDRSSGGRSSTRAPRADIIEYALGDGWTALAGRTAHDNDTLSIKLAGPNDWWFHARGMSGSHVVLQGPPGREPDRPTLERAAAIAAWHSKARGGGLVAVSATRAQYVTKPRGAKPGTVQIRRETVFKVRPTAGDRSPQDSDEEGESPRQAARRQRQAAGDLSASMAQTLMRLPAALLGGLNLDEDLLAAVQRARGITSRGARRREERRLAGELRQVDIDELQARLSSVQGGGGGGDARRFQQAERWRARLIEEGDPAADAFCASFAGVDRAALANLVEEARRERTTGRSRGAARVLFRLVMAAVRQDEGLGITK